MFTKMILVLFLAFILVGCATGAKKNIARPQSAVSQKTLLEESFDDKWPSESYEAPKQKTSSATAAQLSPKQIQRALKSAGFYDGPIDGKVGPKTKAAITKFQKAKGLKADGIVGKKTVQELKEYL